MPDGVRRFIVRLSYGWGPRVMSGIRKRWVRIRNPLADIRFGKGCVVGPGFWIHAPWGGTFVAGYGCEFRHGFRAELAAPESRIEIGNETRFTYDAMIQCAGTISIGDRVTFAQQTFVVDGSHRFRDLERPMIDQGYDLRVIRIDDDAAIMAKTTVIASVGRRAFVGAGSVVTRDIPPYTVAVGSPAEAIDYFGPSEEVPA